MIGKRISHYEVEEKIGEGGMGAVYKARDMQLGRMVALKFLPPEALADSDRQKRFAQEARAASALNHPNIITIYEIAQRTADKEPLPFIAMEYVEGKTLAGLIAGKGISIKETLKLAVQIADALAAAHSAGIVHRDLKPANVMVTGTDSGRPGVVKVLDFGLAKLTEAHIADPGAATATLSRDAGPRGDYPRYRGLHVSRAGRRAPARLTVGRLQLRIGALRDAHGTASFLRPIQDLDHVRDSAGSAA